MAQIKRLNAAIIAALSAAVLMSSTITAFADTNPPAPFDETDCTVAYDYYEPFLQWVVSTDNSAVNTEMKQDAQAAINLIAETEPGLVDYNNMNDATQLESVYNSLEFINTFNAYRIADGLPELNTNFTILAKAMMNADYEAMNYKDKPLNKSPLFSDPECYSIGYDNPWDLWRTDEQFKSMCFSTEYNVTGIGIRDGEPIRINGEDYGNLVTQNFASESQEYTVNQLFELLGLYESEDVPVKHNFIFDQWEWAPDNSNASAVFICSRGDERILVAPTKTVEGNTVTVSITYKGITYSDSRQMIGEEVTGITLSDTYIELTPGQSYTLKATVLPDNANNKNVIWSAEGNLVSVGQDGKVTMGTKYGKTTVTATTVDGSYKATCTVQMRFEDVTSPDEYYYEPVYWAADKGITNGYADGLFRPKNDCTREAAVTFLWRLAGKPEPKTKKSPFSDVKDPSKYYYKAVLWANEKGIAKGYSDGTFRPNDTCLREHVVTFLWRYAGQPTPKTKKSPFSDIRNTSKYYYKAVLWAAENGITKGYTDGTFKPDETCLREHVVTFLWRYAEKPTSKTNTNPFESLKISDYLKKAVRWVSESSIAKGYESGVYKAKIESKLNDLREQVVTFLHWLTK